MLACIAAHCKSAW